MFNPDNSLIYAQKFVNKVVARGLKLKYAKLFGSYSKNINSAESDVDVLLVSAHFLGVGFIDNKLFAEELIEFDVIQVKTYNESDYEEGDPFIEEINKTAIPLKI